MPRTWFHMEGAHRRDSDRTLDQQLIGLDLLWPLVDNRSVLDVGCAEGLISIECCRQGAAYVHGIEIRADAVKLANHHGNGWPFEAVHADARDYTPRQPYDVVLLLAVLHKLRDPSAALVRLVAAASRHVVIRLPHDDWPVLRDMRSGNRPHDLERVMLRCGFELYETADGPVDSGKPAEWVGYFSRVRARP
jgi:SAM-dependent methyltransferase